MLLELASTQKFRSASSFFPESCKFFDSFVSYTINSRALVVRLPLKLTYEVAVVTASFRRLPRSMALSNPTSWLCLPHPKILQSTDSHRRWYVSIHHGVSEILSLPLSRCKRRVLNAGRLRFQVLLLARNPGRPICGVSTFLFQVLV